jgi:hypothetical protein
MTQHAASIPAEEKE